MGGCGGMARGLALHLRLREVARGVILGALLATGLGVLLPLVLEPWVGSEAPSTPAVLAACAFLVGFVQDVVIARLQRGPKDE